MDLNKLTEEEKQELELLQEKPVEELTEDEAVLLYDLLEKAKVSTPPIKGPDGSTSTVKQVKTGSPSGDTKPAAQGSSKEMVIKDLTDDGLVVTFRGNARVAGEDFYLSADVIRLRVGFHGGRYKNPRPLSIYAEGIADLRRGTERITAHALYLDFITETGLALKARIRGIATDKNIPVHFYANVVRQVSRYRFVCETPGFFSTSQFATPHYRVEGRRLEMTRGSGWHRWRERSEEESGPRTPQSMIVASRGNVVYIESIPVFYWPFIAKDVAASAFLLRSLEYGSSGNLGSTVKATWNLYDLGILYNRWSELTLRTDWYSDRGFGIGMNFDYEARARHGFAKFYYIRDSSDTDDRNLPTPVESRGEITWRHREQLPYNVTADIDISRVSDRNFLRIYDRSEWDERKDREATLFLSRPDANRLLTAQWTSRINDFRNTVERQAVGFHAIGEPVFDTPLLWTSHNEIGRLNLRMDEDLNLAASDAIARADSAHELSWPFSLGPLRLDPFLWGDLTFFSKQRRRQDAALRAASAFGVRAATNFYRTFDIQSDALGLDRVRHILTPTAEYRNLWGVTKSPSRLIQHDEIDAVDRSQTLRLGLHNRFQTHRYVNGRRRVIDFLTADIDYLGAYRETNFEHKENSLQTNITWRANENITFTSTDNRLSIENGDLERLNGAVTLNYWRPFRITYSQDYYIDTEAAGKPDHLVSGLTLAYRPLYSRWRVEFGTAYDFQAQRQPGDTKDPGTLGTSIFFYRQLDDWELALGVELDQGRASETRFTTKLTPPVAASTTPSFR